MLGVLLGALLGYLIGLIFAGAGINIGPWDLSGWPPVILAWVMALAGGIMGVEGSRRFRSLYFWWQGQPSATRVEHALQQAIERYPGAEQVWAEPLRRLAQQKEQWSDADPLIAALQSHNWIERFTAQKALVAMGGEVTEVLREIAVDKLNPLWEVAIWLLSGIDQETTDRFSWRTEHTLCPNCLTRFGSRPVNVGLGIPLDYYGCRVCGQSREYLYLPQGVVAVLDEGWGKVRAEQDGLLLINWLVHRVSFDFDWVEIRQAADEDVERFAVQVGNDTDSFRQPRYKRMHCLIAPDCKLSENTMRILQRTFGEVEREQTGK